MNDSPASSSLPHRRRKIRKGTFSCWECKNRKRKCHFQPGISECLSCRQKGLQCLTQEYDTGESGYAHVAKRIGHVEGLVSQLLQQRQDEGRTANVVDHDAAMTTIPRQPSKSTISVSTFLYSVCPSPSELALILHHGDASRMPTRILWSAERYEDASRGVVQLPPPDAHPVQFGRQLMQIALCLQNSKGQGSHASRYAEIVARHVTSLDVMLDSADGIEILMLEAMYSVNDDNPQVAWLKCRRAISMAQLLGMDRAAKCRDKRALWFRLLYGERIISMELGLPYQVIPLEVDRDSEDLVRDLEYSHVVVAGRIISRNLRMQGQEASFEYDETKSIEDIMKQSMTLLPVEWWSVTSLLSTMAVKVAMAETAKLTSQMNHFWLLMNLYQPYLIQTLVSPSRLHQHLRVAGAVAMASREVLARFHALRKYHCGTLYHGLDPKAMTAAIALLLATISDHRKHEADSSGYMRRPQDLSAVNEMLNIPGDSSWTGTHKKTIRNLLEVEKNMAKGEPYTWSMGKGPGLELVMPYIGVFRGYRNLL